VADSVEPPAGPPLGFPNCPRCTYVRNGPAWVCYGCAAMKIEGIRPDCCPICSQILDGGACPNWLCRPGSGRRIQRIWAIAYHSGDLRNKIIGYKYEGRRHWAPIFGRLLVGWLEDNAAQQAPPDLIVANPTYVGAGGSDFPHTETVLAAAEREDPLRRWAFDVGDPRAIVKTGPTQQKSAGKTAADKRAAARELPALLQVIDRSRIAGRRILVYDDVCTTGSQLDAVAGVLIDQGGAASVEGIVLARTPWRPRPPQQEEAGTLQ
jgi:predicted amidophosphoribosyltransferase